MPAFLFLTMKQITIFFLLVTLVASLSSCETKENIKVIIYEGPISEGENIYMQHTEKEKIKLVLQAKKYFEFPNGDREFPEGIYIEFYDEDGKLTSTLKANHAFFFKGENKWRGRGKVEVINIEKKEQLNTEELFWKPDTKKIFTEKFVTIRLENEILYGTGLTAAEDLSTYKISNLEGEFDVKE